MIRRPPRSTLFPTRRSSDLPSAVSRHPRGDDRVHPGVIREPRVVEDGVGQEFPNALRTRCPDEARSEEHTSELQSQSNLVCRLLLEKKKTISRRSRVPSSIL